MVLRWPFNVNTTQQIPLEQWQSQQQYQQQRDQQQPTQQMLYTSQQRQQMQHMQRQQQQRLATEVTDLRKPNNYNTNNNNVNYNNIPPPQQQQPAQLPTQFNTRQPNSYPYYYSNYNRVPQMQGQMPRQLPANYSYPQYGVAAKNSSTEQFEKFDPSQRNARTFGLISDFINSLTSSPCVNPCTIEAYSQNRCCIVVVNPDPPVCCQYPMPRPQPPVMPPIPMPPPPQPPMYPPRPPISCCSACSYGYFGPPPCGYYGGSGVIRRGGGLFGSGGLFGGGGFIGSNPRRFISRW
ncbi:uncharacterized protein LOC126758972 [Bactrocera neohumeralis]|uniref:uncharacterized protein LOC126758972 n=1 Tax=Bactrocera neohumeralis TaxID=98809 RepID=UPI002165823D|nr:uncharacterized protein LOC126758972 [Bactrocera neohumeralis]